jgi:transcriptional regulator with XRE-family HTH domain
MDQNILEAFFRFRCVDLRKKSKKSQEEFTEDTGFNANRIEKEKGGFHSNTLFRICQYYNISITQFFEPFDTFQNNYGKTEAITGSVSHLAVSLQAKAN